MTAPYTPNDPADEGGCWFADRAAIEAACGHPIPDEVWSFVPWGRRVVVVRERPEQLYRGKIIIPATAQVDLTQGWVVSAGHMVGTDPMPGAPGASPIPPRLLVGRKVLFGKFAGTNFNAEADSSMGDGHERAGYVILRDEDLYGELLAEPAMPRTGATEENAS